MDIKVGDTFKSSWDGVDFAVKKIVNDLVVLESPDSKRQILTRMNSLIRNTFYLKRENKEP